MAHREENRNQAPNPDQLPNVGVRKLQGPEYGSNAPEGTLWIDRQAFLSHYRHLLVRRARDPETKRCCAAGPSAIVHRMEESPPEPSVDDGPGTDEEQANPLPSDREWA